MTVLGRTLILAWLTAAFLHIQWGRNFSIQDAPLVGLVLQAGVLYGYYILLFVGGRFALLLVRGTLRLMWKGSIAFLFSSSPPLDLPAPPPAPPLADAPMLAPSQKDSSVHDKKKHEPQLKLSFLGRLKEAAGAILLELFNFRTTDPTPGYRTLARAVDVATMFIAFLAYSEEFARQIAPIGLAVSLLMYAAGIYEQPNDKPHSSEH